MADRAGTEPPIQPLQFVPAEGSPVYVGRRDRAERIREALTDLRLVIDGCARACGHSDVPSPAEGR